MAALTFRQIDLNTDADLAFESYRDAHAASFGSNRYRISRTAHLAWLARRIEEFPDGHVIGHLGEEFVGQLEIQVQYGLKTGYINLFYVAPRWRRLGMGRQIHDYADRYLRSWEATAVELHVAAINRPAIAFYRSLGYRTFDLQKGGDSIWQMRRELVVPSEK